MSYSRRWDIVVVPFPFTDQKTTKVRPAVVLSTDTLRQRNGKYIVAMITSASNTPHYGDVPISDMAVAGLPAASVVRPSKLTVIEDGDVFCLLNQKISSYTPPSCWGQFAHTLRIFCFAPGA